MTIAFVRYGEWYMGGSEKARKGVDVGSCSSEVEEDSKGKGWVGGEVKCHNINIE